MSTLWSKKSVMGPVLLVIGAYSVCAQADSEERSIGAFSRLSVRDGIDVYLTQASAPSLRVETDGFDLERIVTEVHGDELMLYIDGGRGLSFGGDRDVKVYLDFVELSAIDARGGSDISGRGDMRFDALSVQASGGSDIDFDAEARSLQFELSGGSDLDVSGSAQSLTVEASGGSDISARSLETERVVARLSGGSGAVIRVSQSVTVDASGGSDVVIHGNPTERTVHNDRSSDIVWR